MMERHPVSMLWGLAALFLLLLGNCSATETIGYFTGLGDTGNLENETDSAYLATERDSVWIPPGTDSVPAQCARPTMYVDGRYLYDTCGQKVIPIGVNEMVVWHGSDRTGAAVFPEIKKTGANAVRFSWSTGGRGASVRPTFEELDHAIDNCIHERMIAIPEIHDYSREFEMVPEIVDWWITPNVVDIIRKHERHLLVNIANGAGDDTVDSARFIQVYRDAIDRMRGAGIRVPLVIEASGSGSDIALLRETFTDLLAADPLGNLMFSLHIWWAAPDGSTDRIKQELQASADVDLPLIISEFAPLAGGCEQFIDYDTVMEYCVKFGYGFFPWTWGWVNNADCIDLGMTYSGIYGDWRETPVNGRWGERVALLSEYSIQNQAVEVSSFGPSQ